jgi:hypothetical protein
VEQATGATGPVHSIDVWVAGSLIGGVAVGGSGTGIRLYYDGSAWSNHTSGTSTLMSTTRAGQDPAEWWACGLSGIVYRATVPNAFGRYSPDFTANDLYYCGGPATNDVYAAGTNGFLAHFDGTAWTSTGYVTNTTETIFAVARCSGASGTAGMWLAGGNGVIRYATPPFTTFTEQGSGTTQALWGLDAASCTDVYAVGAGGTILHYDGTSWLSEPSGTLALLADVVIRTRTDGSFRDAWAVGANGTILHGTR